MMIWVDGQTLTERIEVDLAGDGTWTDLSGDVFDSYQFDQGIRGANLLRRTATPGRLTFELNNSARNEAGLSGRYSVGHVNCLSGWQKGIEARLVYGYEAIEYVKWRGRIADIQPVVGFPGGKVHVICENYVGQLRKPIGLPVSTTNKTAAEGVAEILGKMEYAPAEVDYGLCAETFDAIFDVVKRNASGMGEISKLMLGEFGWFFVRGSMDSGEVVTVQGRNTREGLGYRDIPVGSSEASLAGTEDEEFLTTEAGEMLVLDEVETIHFSANAYNPAALSEIYNEITVRVYPRREDETDVVLYEHGRTIELEAGAVLELAVGYSDPNQEAQEVTAALLYAPVSGTDYTANAAADGSGTDKTAQLGVTFESGTAKSKLRLENLDAAKIYITLLRLRGRGRYAYQTVDVVVEDAASIAQYGRHPLVVDTSYVNDEASGMALAGAILAATKEPVAELEVLYLMPLMSSANLYTYLLTEPGDRIPVDDEEAGIDSDYFVQHLTATRTENGNLNAIYTIASERMSVI